MPVFDNRGVLLPQLGGFWNRTYQGIDQVALLAAATAEMGSRREVEVDDLLATMSRRAMSPTRRDARYPLILRESDRTTVELPRYDTGGFFDGGSRYDVPEPARHSFPAPRGLVAGLLVNRIDRPSLWLQPGVDYVIEDGRLLLGIDPFDDARLAPQAVWADGEISDREVLLWVLDAEFDEDRVWRQHGYVVGAHEPSTPAGLEMVNTIWDALLRGSTRAEIKRIASLAADIPLAVGDETVDRVLTDGAGIAVVTDKRVYRLHAAATVVVSAGDALRPGDPLSDGLLFHEPVRGTPPSWLPALALGRDLLEGCFLGDLVFEDRDVDLDVVLGTFTRVSWELGGHAVDTAMFFELLHDRGVAEALRPIDECEICRKVIYPANDCDEETVEVRRATMAHWLDRRENPIGEPTATTLPATVNPLRLLFQYVLRHHVAILRVRAEQAGPAALGLNRLGWIRRLTPPHTLVLIVLDMTVETESVTMPTAGEISGSPGAYIVAAPVGPAYVSPYVEGAMARGACR